MNWLYNSIKEEEAVQTIEDILGGHAVVVYNDDVNTFDHVIECLVKYCKHDPIQAEQCSLIIHFKGKCAVMHGVDDKLKSVCQALCDEGLSAVLEEA
jgi:ATP-dependent Clp protease adaptor protein ClpS